MALSIAEYFSGHQNLGKSHYCNLELTNCNKLDPRSWIIFETAVKKRFCKQLVGQTRFTVLSTFF